MVGTWKGREKKCSEEARKGDDENMAEWRGEKRERRYM